MCLRSLTANRLPRSTCRGLSPCATHGRGVVAQLCTVEGGLELVVTVVGWSYRALFPLRTGFSFAGLEFITFAGLNSSPLLDWN